MATQSSIDTILSSDPEFSKHFLLKILSLKSGEFLFISLKEDSTGKDLESIMNTLDHFYEAIEKNGFINIAFSFKEVEYFSDIGLGLTIGFSERVASKGGKFIILEPIPYVQNVIEILELDKFWTLYNSEKEFLEEMNI